MLHLLQMVHLRCSLLSFSRFKTLGSSHSWSCLPCCASAFSGNPTSTNTVFFSDFSGLYTFTALPGPLLTVQRSRPTLAFTPLIILSPTSNLLPLHPHHCLMFLDVFLYLLLPFPPPPGFFNRMPETSLPGALHYYTLSRLILLTLYVSRNLTLTHFPLSESLDSLLCDLISFTPSLAFSLPMPRTQVAASSFSSGRPHPF